MHRCIQFGLTKKGQIELALIFMINLIKLLFAFLFSLNVESSSLSTPFLLCIINLKYINITSYMKLSLALAFALIIGVTQNANLVQAGVGAVRPYQQIINGKSYGSSNSKCYNFCEYGQTCTIVGNAVNCKAFCGDGIRAGSQINAKRCDDGNTNKKDGCDDTCNVQSLYQCSGEPSVCVKLCGDGVLNTAIGQFCDDGNLTPADGCSGICVVNPGWQCTSIEGQKSVCTPKCGDGKRLTTELGARKCDDGNTVSGDGCSSTCDIENLFKCTGTPSVCENLCKNGKLNTAVGELCDDGNKNNTGGCSSTCTVNTGWRCISKQGLVSNCTRIP